MDGGQERGRVFRVSRGDPAPALQVQKRVLHQVPLTVNVFVVNTLHLAVFLGRDHHLHARRLRVFHNCVAVVTAIRQQILRIQAFDQLVSLRAISGGTLRNKHSERITMRIHGQMYLGVEPPFVRLMS